jgi:hypothetical protein
MSTLALLGTAAAVPLGERQTKSRPSLFKRLLAAREAEARRRTRSYLAGQSSERLAALGFTADDLAALRKGESRLPTHK